MSFVNRFRTNKNKRYHTGEFKELEDISDPKTTEDEQSISWKAWISDNQFLAITVVLGVLVGIAVFGNWALKFIPSIIGNIWFQRAAAVTTVGTVAYVLGVKSHSGRMRELDWLVLVKSNGVKFYAGYYGEPDDGRYPLFIPVRGFTMMEHQSHPYTIEDFSRELVRMQSDQNRDPKDPVVIRLHPEVASTAATDYGRVVAQLSEGLELDEFGRESNVVATLPDLADDDALDALRNKLSEMNTEYKNIESDAQMYRRQRDNARDEARKNRKELIDEFLEHYRKVNGGEPGMHGGVGGFEEPTWDEPVPEDDSFDMDEMDQVEEELSDED